ncbi:hypothetical protein BD560DRAFT_447975 [Blakeslea trispora]|nr:hypothetical protein BD560DRAFT_447975 [Blakeslea trispora]
MALSHKSNFGHSDGLDPPSAASKSPHNNRNKPTNTSSDRSWSKVAAKRVREVRHSLITSSSDESSTPQTETSTFKSSIWRPGHGSNSVFVDMTGRKESVAEFFLLVAHQYPSRVGVLPQKVGNLRYAEICFDDDDVTVVSSFLKEGLRFADGSVVIPCKALGPHMEVINVRLSSLPFLREPKLLKGLKESLSPFGEILDVGIFLDPASKTYACTGYAVLNVKKKEGAYCPLTHLVPWEDSEDLSFYAVWKQMPPYCKYCHAEGHILANCDKRKAKFSCWTCGANGHMAASCPKDAPQKKPKVKAPVVPKLVFDFSERVPPPGSKRRRGATTSPRAQALVVTEDDCASTASPRPTRVVPPAVAVKDSLDSSSLLNFTPLSTQEILFVDNRQAVTTMSNDMTDDVASDSDNDMNLDSSLLPFQNIQLSQESSLPLLDTQSREFTSPSNMKSNNPQTQAHFIRYLRSLNFDLMAFQETHVSSMNQSFINTQFQAQQALWTHECGLVSFSPMLHLSDDLLPDIHRVILSQVSSPNQLFLPFHVLVIYAPAHCARERREFFCSLFETLMSPALALDFDRLLVMGDFNYSYRRPNLGTATSLEWVSSLDTHCFNALQTFGLHEIPTFGRNDTVTSTIDYIFVSHSFQNVLVNANLQLINPGWTDHSLLSVQMALAASPTGPGLWRGNPRLLQLPEYHHRLIDIILSILDEATSKCSTPQDQWDFFKKALKRVTKCFGVNRTKSRKARLRELQSQRNHFLRSLPSGEARLTFLRPLEQEITILQQETTESLALKSGQRWREKGETSVRYLKRLVQQRQATERITAFRDDETKESRSDSASMLRSANRFY